MATLPHLKQRCIITESGCWEWQGGLYDGKYSTVKHEGKKWRGHRLAYLLHYGELPPDMDVLHNCDNPLCINPLHLRLGDDHDNVWDRIKRDRSAKGEASPSSKLTEEQVKNIRSDNRTQSAIAKEYGVSQMTVCKIKTRQTWRHVK